MLEVGDLVCWHDKPSLLGIVISEDWRLGWGVQWANGATGNHSLHYLVKLETS